MANRAEIVALVGKHVEELEQLEKRRATDKAASDRNALMDGGRAGGASGSRASRAMDRYEMTTMGSASGSGAGAGGRESEVVGKAVEPGKPQK